MSEVPAKIEPGQPAAADPVAVQSTANFIQQAESQLSGLIRRQFSFAAAFAVVSVALFVGTFWLVERFSRQPANTELLTRLEVSAQKVEGLATKLAAGLNPDERATFLTVLEHQEEARSEAVRALREQATEPSQESQTLLQIIGSALVLALLGTLGLQRLQNIDAEINNLRSSIFDQIEARSQESQKLLEALAGTAVEKRFVKARTDLEVVERQVQALRQELVRDAARQREEMQREVASVRQSVAEVSSLVDRYPWLKSREQFDSAAKTQHASSVEQAHRLAVLFNLNGDRISAREALLQIKKRALPGDANDFHNAHAEAMKMDELSIGLELAEVGLERYPDQFDLVADKVKALQSCGRTLEAVELFDDWYQRKPAEALRSWRPIVFYVDAFEFLELDDSTAERVEAILESAVTRMPRETRLWNSYFKFLKKRGMLEEAESVIRRALTLSPLSQMLNYYLGEMLLGQGRVQDAVAFLEKAFASDFQEQYQHDLHQLSVRCTLAQAYEAKGDLPKAELLYHSMQRSAAREDYSGAILTYATSRLEAIALQRGELPEPSSEPDPDELKKFFEMLAKRGGAHGTDGDATQD